MLFLNHLTRTSNLKDFSHKVDPFVQGLDMLSTGRLSQTLIHPRQMLKLLRKVVCAVTTKHSQFVSLYTKLYHYYETHSVSFTNTDEHLIIKYQSFSLTRNSLQWIFTNYTLCMFPWIKAHMMVMNTNILDLILNRTILQYLRRNI